MEQIQPLEGIKIEEKMMSLPDWFLIEDKKITREYTFKSFAEAVKFVNRVAIYAEKENHHPDICIYYNKVEVTLWTHKIGGLSQADFKLAAEIDKI